MSNGVQPETAAELRKLAAKRGRQDEALGETRAQLARVMHRAVKREGAPPVTVARLAGISRVQAWKAINRIEEGRHGA